jgi:hypothetical protein
VVEGRDAMRLGSPSAVRALTDGYLAIYNGSIVFAASWLFLATSAKNTFRW